MYSYPLSAGTLSGLNLCRSARAAAVAASSRVSIWLYREGLALLVPSNLLALTTVPPPHLSEGFPEP